MKTLPARPSRLAAALLLAVAVAAPAPCPAQTPAPAPGARPAPPPSSSAVATPAARADLLPSTVSPAIARFMSGGGPTLPAPVEPAATPRPRTPAPTLPATDPGNPRADRVARGDLPALPAASAPPAENGNGAAPAGRSPLLYDLKLKAAPLDPTDLRFPINLATALRLSDARPLIVAAAQAGVWVAEAQLTRANVLWVPTAYFGADYLRHDGGGPDFNKGILTAPSTNYFMGGAAADLYVNLADAYFEPLVARQNLDAANYDVQASKNDALQRTADAYFRVHQARGNYAGALYAVERGHQLVVKIAELSRELVPRVEVDRARNMLADLEQRAVTARQEWRVASADLTQVLRLDPRAVVVPLEHDHTQVTLIDPGRSLDDLMPVAINNRPELASRRALVEAAGVAIQREKMRPFLPLVLVNGFQTPGMLLQAGIFGLGPNSSLNQWRGRSDVSLQLMWQLESFGIGNLARIKRQRGTQSRAVADLYQTQDMVAADVTRALARVQSGAARVLQADRSLRTAIITFNGHLEGLGQTRRLGNVLVLTFRPQEAVYSLEQLNVSFNEYFTTVGDYNRAQFELFHALGYPAREVAGLRLPGEVQPVDTARPGFLPPVGNGPPPATR